jgi:hypothetical protein
LACFSKPLFAASLTLSGKRQLKGSAANKNPDHDDRNHTKMDKLTQLPMGVAGHAKTIFA